MEIIPETVVQTRLNELDITWTAIGNDYLVRSFPIVDFDQGVELINSIAKVARKAQHHPDLTLTSQSLELRLSTHSVAGITDADFKLARRIDDLFSPHGA